MLPLHRLRRLRCSSARQLVHPESVGGHWNGGDGELVQRAALPSGLSLRQRSRATRNAWDSPGHHRRPSLERWLVIVSSQSFLLQTELFGDFVLRINVICCTQGITYPSVLEFAKYDIRRVNSVFWNGLIIGKFIPTIAIYMLLIN